MGRLAVSAGAARFLQIALRCGRQIEMKHQAHIATVNAHAEGHRRHQNGPLMLKKQLQSLLAGLRIQTGVIRRCRNPLVSQTFRPLLHRTTGAGIDQRSTTGHLQCLQHLRHGVPGAPLHRVVQVVPAGRTHLHERATQIQQANDVGPHPWGCRRAEGQHRHSRAEAADLTQAAVIGAEVMPPGTDAMGFIHRQGHQSALPGMTFQHQPGLLTLKSFRRDVEESQRGVLQLLQGLLSSSWLESGMQASRSDSPSLQGHHLVLHQRHQR